MPDVDSAEVEPHVDHESVAIVADVEDRTEAADEIHGREVGEYLSRRTIALAAHDPNPLEKLWRRIGVFAAERGQSHSGDDVHGIGSILPVMVPNMGTSSLKVNDGRRMMLQIRRGSCIDPMPTASIDCGRRGSLYPSAANNRSISATSL
jgi:hypothetical protein